jgi:hypothetical protein
MYCGMLDAPLGWHARCSLHGECGNAHQQGAGRKAWELEDNQFADQPWYAHAHPSGPDPPHYTRSPWPNYVTGGRLGCINPLLPGCTGILGTYGHLCFHMGVGAANRAGDEKGPNGLRGYRVWVGNPKTFLVAVRLIEP